MHDVVRFSDTIFRIRLPANFPLHSLTPGLTLVGVEMSFEEPWHGLDKQNMKSKIVNNFLPISFNICFGCSKEPSHLDGSFEYPQHMFWLRNKKINFLVRTLKS